MKRSPLRLRTILFWAMLFVSVLPIVFFAVWEQHVAMRDEIDAVKERHLLLAQNLTDFLGRYVKDVRLVFTLAADNLDRPSNLGDIEKTLAGLRVRAIWKLDSTGRPIRTVCAFGCSSEPSLAPRILQKLAPERAQAYASPGLIFFSNALDDDRGKPAIFLLMAEKTGQMIIGEMATDRMLSLQQSVSFGQRGHAVIVDRSGRVIAHPSTSLTTRMADLSGLDIVQKMMIGKSGVETYYSPFYKEKMIAGFSVVPGVGWGVMIPQPYSELVEKAQSLRYAVYAIAGLSILISTVISWWLSDLLSRPLRAVAQTTDRIAQGRLSLRVEELPRFSPLEVTRLASSFNNMMDEIHANTAKLATLMKEANAANKAKSNFLAGISHELRTPLNAILGFSDAILNQIFGPLGNPRYADYIENIHGSGAHLLSLVNDLLDISRLEIGKLELDEQTRPVRELMDDVFECSRPLTRDKDVSVQMHLPPDLPALHCDGARVRQVMLNVIAYGLLRSPEGGVVRIGAFVDGGKRVHITFEDDGPELCQDDVDNLLRPFYQADNAIARTQGGTGLGLPLSKALMENHDGILHIVPSIEGGVVIEIIFPAQRTVENAGSPARKGSQTSSSGARAQEGAAT